MKRTLYEVLEISANASPEVMRAAFRVLTQRYHPDKNKGEDADQMMAEINKAYLTLSDPVSRAEYDASRLAVRRARRPPPEEPAASSFHAPPAVPRTESAKPAKPAGGRRIRARPWLIAVGIITLLGGGFVLARYTIENVSEQSVKQYEAKAEIERRAKEQLYLDAEASFTGTGAPQNYERARELYMEIVNQDRSHNMPLGERGKLAARRLGDMYARGIGVPQNWAQAVKWYEEAANARDTLSMMTLAESYEAGKGAPRNLLMAYAWYNKLAAIPPQTNGVNYGEDVSAVERSRRSISKRDELAKKLTPEELRRAQTL